MGSVRLLVKEISCLTIRNLKLIRSEMNRSEAFVMSNAVVQLPHFEERTRLPVEGEFNARV